MSVQNHEYVFVTFKGALQQVKMKKMYEAELEKMFNTKFQLETQIMALQCTNPQLL